MQRYEARTLTDALETPPDNTTAALTEEGMLGVSVLDKDPQTARTWPITTSSAR